MRLHDFGDFCHWRVVEPEKGRFVWRDAEIDDLRKRGFTILANLGHPPLWAGRPHPRTRTTAVGPVRRRATSPSGRTTSSRRSSTSATASGTGKSGTNRVGRPFFSGTPEEYAELLKVASPRHPACRPAGGGHRRLFFVPRGGVDQTACWRRTASISWTALSYHVYWSPAVTEPAAPGEPTFIEQEVQHFVELMQERGQLKPIYMTEGGLRCPPFASWLPKEGFSRGAAFGSKTGA